MAGLGHLFPRYLFAFQMLVALDIGSHWVHMTATHMSGSSSHKNIDLKKNPLLRLYYTNRACLVSVVQANECAAKQQPIVGCSNALPDRPLQVHVERSVHHALSRRVRRRYCAHGRPGGCLRRDDKAACRLRLGFSDLSRRLQPQPVAVGGVAVRACR